MQVRPTTFTTSAVVGYNDDDEFEPIVNAEADAMPQSFEAKEAQRTAASLVRTLVELRLRGPLLAHPDHIPTKDNDLFNSLAIADGARFPQLGLVICDAILEGTLRLSSAAVGLILQELSDRLSTYAFNRDGDTIKLAVTFLARSASIWLAPKFKLITAAIQQAKDIVLLASTGRLHSWQARLHILLFIDEYLDYDPSYGAWLQLGDTDEADIELGGHVESDWGPLSYLLKATLDADARVRFRAASSAAAIHYLPDLSPDRKAQAYLDMLPKQVMTVFNWDVFLTNLVWKLNTCIASALLRSATIFHLYEVADYNPDFLSHLQPGLEAVASRLGLSSLQPLYMSHANTIVTQQLQNQQSPLRLGPSLYGCSSRREFAELCLNLVGSTILATRQHMAFFDALCKAADVSKQQALERCVPAAAAMAVTFSFAQDAPGQPSHDGAANAEEVLELLPSPDSGNCSGYLAAHSEIVMSHLFLLVDLTLTNSDIVKILEGFNDDGKAAQCYVNLTAHDSEPLFPPTVLEPQYSFWAVLQALLFLRSRFQERLSRRRMVFAALIKLFHAINSSYLVVEQRRYLRSLAVLAALYPKEFQQPMILQQFLHNTINLLSSEDNGPMILDFVRWGFDQLVVAKSAPDGLVDLFVMMSSMFSKLRSDPDLKDTADGLTAVVKDRAKVWQQGKETAPALEYALVFWPAEWTRYFEETFELGFVDVATIAGRPATMNPMALCKRLAATAMEGNKALNRETFMTSTFWHLKKALSSSGWDYSGVMAFLDLLYMSNGHVRAPDMQAIRSLAGRSQLSDLAKDYKDSKTVLRIAIINKIVEQTSADDYQLRTTAIEVLQTILPVISQMSERQKMPPRLNELADLLVPSTATSSSPERAISVILEETEGWVIKSRVCETWARDLALLLDTLAARDDPFYISLQPLLSTSGGATAEFLPYLVQAVLSCGFEEHADQSLQRAAVLSDHFSQVLQYPTAAVETLEAIINIVLHLRNFQPPHMTTDLAYNHWLSIDPLILSEAAGKCGAFASSLLFLELSRDLGEGAACDLSSPRVQTVSQNQSAS